MGVMSVCVMGICVGTHLVSRSLKNSLSRDSMKVRPVVLSQKRLTPVPHGIKTEKAIMFIKNCVTHDVQLGRLSHGWVALFNLCFYLDTFAIQ